MDATLPWMPGIGAPFAPPPAGNCIEPTLRSVQNTVSDGRFPQTKTYARLWST